MQANEDKSTLATQYSLLQAFYRTRDFISLKLQGQAVKVVHTLSGYVIGLSDTGHIQIWDYKHNRLLCSVAGEGPSKKESLVYLKQLRNRILFLGEDGSISSIEFPSCRRIMNLTKYSAYQYLAFSQDDHHPLMAVRDENIVDLIKIEDQNLRVDQSFSMPESIWNLKYRKINQEVKIYALSATGKLYMRDVSSGKTSKLRQDIGNEIYGIDIDSNMILTFDNLRNIRVYTDGNLKNEFRSIRHRRDIVSAVIWNQKVIIHDSEGETFLWDLSDNKSMMERKIFIEEVSSIKEISGETLIMSGLEKGAYKTILINRDGEEIINFSGHDDIISSISVVNNKAANQHSVFSADRAGNIKGGLVRDNSILTIDNSQHPVIHARFESDGEHIHVLYGNGYIEKINILTGKTIKKSRILKSPINTGYIDRSGKHGILVDHAGRIFTMLNYNAIARSPVVNETPMFIDGANTHQQSYLLLHESGIITLHDYGVKEYTVIKDKDSKHSSALFINSQKVVTSTDNGKVQVWRRSSSKIGVELEAEIRIGTVPIWFVSAPAGKPDFVIAGDKNGKLWRVNLSSLVIEELIVNHNHPIEYIANGATNIFVADSMGNIIIADNEYGLHRFSLPSVRGRVNFAEFSADEHKQLLVVLASGKLKVFSLKTNL